MLDDAAMIDAFAHMFRLRSYSTIMSNDTNRQNTDSAEFMECELGLIDQLIGQISASQRSEVSQLTSQLSTFALRDAEEMNRQSVHMNEEPVARSAWSQDVFMNSAADERHQAQSPLTTLRDISNNQDQLRVSSSLTRSQTHADLTASATAAAAAFEPESAATTSTSASLWSSYEIDGLIFGGELRLDDPETERHEEALRLFRDLLNLFENE